jgi:hypothetical protein
MTAGNEAHFLSNCPSEPATSKSLSTQFQKGNQCVKFNIKKIEDGLNHTRIRRSPSEMEASANQAFRNWTRVFLQFFKFYRGYRGSKGWKTKEGEKTAFF